MTSKVAIRSIAREQRRDFVRSMSPGDRRLCFSAVPAPMAELIWPATVVTGYFAYDDEADPSRLLALAQDRQAVIAMPYFATIASAPIFRRWSAEDPIEPGPFGLGQPLASAEPLTPEVIIAPMIAFTRSGGRLGQGGGYFDRAFAEWPEAFRLGLGWSMQEVAALPVDPWDMPLDAILTEREWIASNRGQP